MLMYRLLPLLLALSLFGCDVFSSDSGTSDLTLSGTRSGTLQGNAFFGEASADPLGTDLTLGDDASSRIVSVTFPSRPAVGTFAVPGDVAVRYSTGVLSDAYTGADGTVTLTEVSSGEVRGRLDVGASLFSSEPILQIAGTFRAVAR